VEKIMVKNKKAVGIKLADGTEHFADYVVSASDLRYTLDNLLDGKYQDARLTGLFQNVKSFPPAVQVSLGVNMDLSGRPDVITENIELENPITLAGEKTEWMNFKHFCFDKTLSPNGKSVVESLILTNFDYWKELYRDRTKYEAEKKKIAELVIDMVEKQIPGIRSKIEVIDVATPMTYARYTNNWQGKFMTWIFKPEESRKTLPKTLPGLRNFYLTGMWVMAPGGLPTGAKTARDVMQLICAKNWRKFRTTKT
jgi:phytoene dehydrogenase-like protein